MADKIALSNYKAHTTDKEDNSDSLLFLSHEKLSYERRYSGDWKQHCWPLNACQTIDPEEKRKALVKKNGGYRVFLAGLSEYRKKYITDLYFTLVDLDWKYALTIIFLIYLVSFLLFAAFWWMMAYYNGDFENVGNDKHEFCLEGVSSFPGVILFSLETQTTIGYGVAYPNAMCGPTIPLMYLQVVLGFLIETLMLGLIVVKIARPKYRANTILFSKYATINQENGQLVLQIRVGDLRKSHLVDATITGMVIRKYTTPEGAYYPLYQFRCDFSANEMGDQVFLLWPIILTHVIDKSSPLYNFKPADLSTEKFELIVYLTGTVESTGETCQARSSYLPKEIMWGYRFERIEEYNRGRRRWQIDFTGFEDVLHCQNISHSARELDERKKVGKSKENELCSGNTS
ncbi:G protein-activated inward rectifier potassium channel 4-like [Biomphalaria glabrata]|uniref:G protein-activated inward rectifier potassium channel 4-like n=1 Tax=Biomphalaria glabrata TaxID=6526 RepID=A0A9U8DWX9_BIOGL|nr:G protein-activated inward rectifier potassium channel 4-like [Biomphalaria glabrata]XP_013064958.2 G protein-activated inward rectifier potassium channel 4-like [Biomphalaria glabrata]XP_013064959.2 G protein-activated inward rectifier potassium channel 4-like [Biomphalaria glabrata]XP_013064960.2 G protein-activated inward rectifier potassium channel 4-like [Biomphalaria glabrata]XP_013064961.2 G protein-activated inward rectifier potassium channel 4-like [Biomphalaria glabrata]XP_0130649